MEFKNYNYDAIKYFIAVASHGSLSKASYSLGISESALSQSMKNLEQSLNVILFHRNTRGIILTKEGKTLYEKAQIGNEYFKEAIINTLRTNQNNPLQTFKISAPTSILNNYIIPIMKKMTKKYKNTNFIFTSSTKESNIIEKLQKQEIDLIINKTSRSFIPKEIKTTTISEHDYCFTYNPKHFKLNTNVTTKELENYPIIIKQRKGKNDNSWMNATFKKFIVCKNDETVLNLINNGIGIGLYPKQLAQKEKLEILHLKNYTPIKRTIKAFYLENNEIAKDFMKEISKLV